MNDFIDNNRFLFGFPRTASPLESYAAHSKEAIAVLKAEGSSGIAYTDKLVPILPPGFFSS